MEEIEIQGKKYISSKRAAEITGYAKDYVGQLARSKKVPATRVGRSWYVSESDILVHAGKPSLEPSEELADEGSAQESILTQAVNSSHTSPKYSLRDLQSKGPTKRFDTWSSVQYFEDDNDLLPKVVSAQKQVVSTPEKSLKNIAMSVNKIQPRKIAENNALTIDGISRKTKPVTTTPLARASAKKDARFPAPSFLMLASTGAVVTVSVFLLVFFGTQTPNDLIAPTNQVGNPYFAGFNTLLEFFLSLFVLGVSLLLDFATFLLSSLEDFFYLGLNFFKDLLNLG